jgi:formylglycine-generating enzyme required for sulfatase activity
MSPVVLSVPGGGFRMGSDAGRPDEAPARRVFVSAFAIGRTPVTNSEFSAFLRRTGAPPPPWWGKPGFDAADQPVVGVSWHEAVGYAEWLGAEDGGRWRLPTEAEWERAARGGQADAATAWGDRLPAGEVPEGALAGPWPVGRGTPNGFGLFDMGTIVHEWCADWYQADYYQAAPTDGPAGPAEGERRASRGGSWRHHVRWSSPASRSSLPPTFHYSDYGFRLVLEA